MASYVIDAIALPPSSPAFRRTKGRGLAPDRPRIRRIRALLSRPMARRPDDRRGDLGDPRDAADLRVGHKPDGAGTGFSDFHTEDSTWTLYRGETLLMKRTSARAQTGLAGPRSDRRQKHAGARSIDGLRPVAGGRPNWRGHAPLGWRERHRPAARPGAKRWSARSSVIDASSSSIQRGRRRSTRRRGPSTVWSRSSRRTMTSTR